MTIRAVVKGIGHYLPDRIVTNKDLEALVETTDDWIRTRSGIERRHFAAEGQMTSDLATRAARAALHDAGLAPSDLDAIIVATSTPDLTFPSVATMVQGQLGMTRGFAFDVQAVCAGFVFALSNAQALIVSDQAKRVMVIGAETFSRLMEATLTASLDVVKRDSLFVDVMDRSPALQRQNWDIMPNGREFIMEQWRASNAVEMIVNWRRLVEVKQ